MKYFENLTKTYSFAIILNHMTMRRIEGRGGLQLSQEPLRAAIAEYKKGIRTREMWTAYWRAKFQVEAGRIGLNLEVPDCNWTEEEIRRPMLDIYGKEIEGLMVPVMTGITLPILGQMYPAMKSSTVAEDSPVIDTHDTEGWVKVYGLVDGPNRNAGRAAAEKFADDNGYLPGREKTYILGSQAKKDFSNQYFDQRSTFSWLPGSQVDDGLVYASFFRGGGLGASWDLDPDIPRQDGGWRFEEVKK